MFAAAQAAQKSNVGAGFAILKFAAAQAAQKGLAYEQLMAPEFAAAQAAQKSPVIALPVRRCSLPRRQLRKL